MMLRGALALVALAFVGLTVAENGALAGRPLYAVVSATMLRGGSKNVRWATITNNQLDEQGKLKPQKAGQTNAPCTDMSGKERKHGEEYDRPNGKFKYRCNNGLEEVSACVSSDRANKALIEVNKTLEVNGFKHYCQSFENGSAVYTQDNSCRDAKGKEVPIGTQFLVANLQVECGDKTYKVVGCSYKDTSGKEMKLNGGEERKEGKQTHKCEHPSGSDIYQYSVNGVGCQRRGKEYDDQEKFQDNHLKYACREGNVDITGCYIKEGTDLEIGKDVVENGQIHRCYRLGTSVEYTEYACGGKDSKSCTPPPVEDVPDEVPMLGRGLKSPGVSSIAIESNGTPPKKFKIDFDKIKMGGQ